MCDSVSDMGNSSGGWSGSYDHYDSASDFDTCSGSFGHYDSASDFDTSSGSAGHYDSAEDFCSFESLFDNPGQEADNIEDPVDGVYTCNRPLGQSVEESPGNTHIGPDMSWNPLSHEYSCVVRDGLENCGGQTSADGSLWGPGAASTDTFSPEHCVLVSSNPCDMDCMDEEIDNPSRPDYGLLGPGTNCHEWNGDSLSQCEDICSTSNPERASNPGGDVYSSEGSSWSEDLDWSGGFNLGLSTNDK